MCWSCPGRRGRAALGAEPWWDLRDAVEEGLRNPFRGSPDDAIDELDRRLREAVALQMEADVPLGAFLSGGIDSSTVVAMMQSQASRPVKTFTIGFEEAGYDESRYAKAVAEHLGTEHTEYRVTADEAREQIPRLSAVYDEPFADSSQIPTLLLAKLTRQQVTVCLSGDGGDELFCGYDRYFYLSRLWQRIGWCPFVVRGTAAEIAKAAACCSPASTAARKLRTLSEFLSSESAGAFYARFNTHWRDPAEVVLGANPAATVLTSPAQWPRTRTVPERMMYLDAVTYLPEDLLTKVDRASMAVGLEARVPLLDHRFVAFAWTIPQSLKVRDGETKWLLRRVLERYVPRRLTDRPKMGFGIPLGAWLRGPLRAWAEELLDQRRLAREGFLRPEPIRRAWAEHLSGRTDWQYRLWDVLVFQTWLESR